MRLRMVARCCFLGGCSLLPQSTDDDQVVVFDAAQRVAAQAIAGETIDGETLSWPTRRAGGRELLGLVGALAVTRHRT